MANLPVKDANDATKYVKATGTGTDADPHVIENAISTIGTVGALSSAPGAHEDGAAPSDGSRVVVAGIDGSNNSKSLTVNADGSINVQVPGPLSIQSGTVSSTLDPVADLSNVPTVGATQYDGVKGTFVRLYGLINYPGGPAEASTTLTSNLVAYTAPGDKRMELVQGKFCSSEAINIWLQHSSGEIMEGPHCYQSGNPTPIVVGPYLPKVSALSGSLAIHVQNASAAAIVTCELWVRLVD